MGSGCSMGCCFGSILNPKEGKSMNFIKVFLVVAVAMVLSGCVSFSHGTDEKTGIEVTSIGIVGCGNPSQRLTYVRMPGQQKADQYASTESDPCTTMAAAATGAAGSIVSAGVIRPSNTTINTSSGAIAQQGTEVTVNN